MSFLQKFQDQVTFFQPTEEKELLRMEVTVEDIEEEKPNTQLFQTELYTEELNRGAFGVIYQTKDDQKSLLVKKTTSLTQTTFGVSDATTVREIFVGGCCSDPFVMHLSRFSCRYPFHCSVFFPKANGGSLKQWILSDFQVLRHQLSEEDLTQLVVDVIHQLVLVVSRLHQQKVYHMDLKSENILIFEVNGRMRLHISDFGTTTESYPLMCLGDFADFDFSGMGTPEYLPLESLMFDDRLDSRDEQWLRQNFTPKSKELQEARHTLLQQRKSLSKWKKQFVARPTAAKVDVWGLGGCVLELLAAVRGPSHPLAILKPHLKTPTQAWYEFIQACGTHSDFPETILYPHFFPTKKKTNIIPEILNKHTRELLYSFVSSCFFLNPTKRASLQELLQHPLFVAYSKTPVQSFVATTAEVVEFDTFVRQVPQKKNDHIAAIASFEVDEARLFFQRDSKFLQLRSEALYNAMEIVYPRNFKEMMVLRAAERRTVVLTCPVLLLAAAMFDITWLRLYTQTLSEPWISTNNSWHERWLHQMLAFTCVNVAFKKYTGYDDRNDIYLQNLVLFCEMIPSQKLLRQAMQTFQTKYQELKATSPHLDSVQLLERQYSSDVFYVASRLEHMVFESLLYLYNHTKYVAYVDRLETMDSKQQLRKWTQWKLMAQCIPFFFLLEEYSTDKYHAFIMNELMPLYQQTITTQQHPLTHLTHCMLFWIATPAVCRQFVQEFFQK